ncbi:Rel domain (RHD) DNA-binding domain [Trinorchestia longiramus]|nr:Rel domain (RHD) DNA-binding domain [Trinorchestia longiramus]
MTMTGFNFDKFFRYLRRSCYSGGERPLGSPYSGGMASPYSDHSAGLPSPPTVVADYNRPYDCVNTDGPHLILTEQPQGKFRFRYKSEMVGTHGQLKAERADRNKPIFPTVKLAKWSDGPAVIRLALYTGEDNPNQRRRHVHELSGKNCDKDTGMCEVVVDHTTDYTATFQNLGIIHIAKRDVKDIIRQRKKAELIEHARLRRPHCTPEEIRQSITPTDLKKFDEEAEEIAKTMDLNKVVLRFQAFQYDTSLACYRPITRSVDSELVVNLKNASTGELKIVRMSQCSAPCTGGTEVWMLVEKVKKTNIKIKFFESDADGNEVWSAYGEFSEADVHHQYAIIFRTPPYRSTNLRSPVPVKVQLERPNDKDISEPRDFTYYPGNRKRQSPFMETARLEEDEDYPQGGGGRSKRMCPGGPFNEPLDLRFSEFSSTHTSSDNVFARCDYSSSKSLTPGQGYEYSPQSLATDQRCSSAHRPRVRTSSGSVLPSQSGETESQHCNLFRTEFEKLVDLKEHSKKQNVRKISPASSSSMFALCNPSTNEVQRCRNLSSGSDIAGFLSPNEATYSNIRGQSCSQESLIESFTRACNTDNTEASTLYVKNKGNFSMPSVAEPTQTYTSQTGSYYLQSPILGSSPTSHTSTPYTSPYHKPAVDYDFRLLTPYSISPSSVSVSLVAASSNIDQEQNIYGTGSSTTFLAGTTNQSAQEQSNYDSFHHSASLPSLLQDSQSEKPTNPLSGCPMLPDKNVSQDNGAPTYAELQPVQRAGLRPPLEPLLLPQRLEAFGGWGVRASPPPQPVESQKWDQESLGCKRRSSVPNMSGPFTPPLVTVTPPVESSSPFSSLLWSSADDILE